MEGNNLSYQKPEAYRSNPALILPAACAGLVLCACLCVGLVAIQTFDSVGNLWNWAVGLFTRQESDGMNLYQVLRNRSEGTFRLGEDCSFSYTQGSRISSEQEQDGGGFSRDLSAPEVQDAVIESLQNEWFRVQNGTLQAGSASRVDAALLGEDRVSFQYSRDETSGSGAASWSLDGVVEGDTFQGSFHGDQSISTVKNGQGIERSVTLVADLACPVRWEAGP